MSERIKRNPTRQRRYSKKIIIAALRASNGLVSAAATRLGCDRKTIRNYFERYPELDQELRDIRDSFVDLAEGSLLAQVQEKNTAATIFLLRCLGKSRGWVDSPNVQLHAVAEAGSGTWMEIMSRVMKSGQLPDSNAVILDVPACNVKRIEKGVKEDDDEDEDDS